MLEKSCGGVSLQLFCRMYLKNGKNPKPLERMTESGFISAIYERSVDMLRTQLRTDDISAQIYVGHER